jgi:hypothetical protein
MALLDVEMLPILQYNDYGHPIIVNTKLDPQKLAVKMGAMRTQLLFLMKHHGRHGRTEFPEISRKVAQVPPSQAAPQIDNTGS